MTPQTAMSIRDLGELIATTFRLGTKPIAVHGSDSPPEAATFLPSIHRCLATAMVRMSTGDAPPVVYLGEDAKAGLLPRRTHPCRIHQAPSGDQLFRLNRQSRNPGCTGRIPEGKPGDGGCLLRGRGGHHPPGRYLVVRNYRIRPGPVHRCPGHQLLWQSRTGPEPGCAGPLRPVGTILPCPCSLGPACATLVTYPAGMAANAPPDSHSSDRRTDPQLCPPPDILGIGIPVGVARRVAENIGKSFITKRTEVAFPDHEERREILSYSHVPSDA